MGKEKGKRSPEDMIYDTLQWALTRGGITRTELAQDIGIPSNRRETYIAYLTGQATKQTLLRQSNNGTNKFVITDVGKGFMIDYDTFKSKYHLDKL